MRPSTVLALLVAALLFAGPVIANEVLIRGARVYTVTSASPLENTDVLVRNGMIAAVGRSLAASADATIVVAGNHHLTPGFWGGLSGVGLIEIPHEDDTVDAVSSADSPSWRQQWRPEFDVTLAYNPRSTVVPVTRIEGVTWSLLAPAGGDSIMGGQGAAITLDGGYDAVPTWQSYFIRAARRR